MYPYTTYTHGHTHTHIRIQGERDKGGNTNTDTHSIHTTTKKEMGDMLSRVRSTTRLAECCQQNQLMSENMC